MLLLKATTVGFPEDSLRVLCALLCRLIYPMISWAYELFINVSGFGITDGVSFQPIYQRITMILSIVMVFYVSFEFVKYVIQPDTMTDKEKGAGNIVYKMIAVVVLIAFVPKIFSLAYKAQDAIIDSNLLSKVILGKTNVDSTSFGRGFSANILSNLYYFDSEAWEETIECDGIPCAGIVSNNLSILNETGRIPNLSLGINAAGDSTVEIDGNEEKSKEAIIHFDGLLAVLIGGFIAYMLILYCIDVGVRAFQLLYLQIIAPIPIIGFLSPKKDGIFQKWCKQCLTTYLDLFIRMSIIYFILLVCETLLDSTLFAEFEDSAFFVKIVLIMGLLVFAKKAPKMLEELFPKMGAAGGNFGLKPGERIEPIKKLGRPVGAIAGTAIGAGYGLATGIRHGLRKRNATDKNGNPVKGGAIAWSAVKGAVGGTIGGAARGLYNGSKKGNVFKNSIEGAKKQATANQKFGNRQENGYTFSDQVGDVFRHATGGKTRTQVLDEKKAPLERHKKALEELDTSVGKMREYALEKATQGKSPYNGEYQALKSKKAQLSSVEGKKDFVAGLRTANPTIADAEIETRYKQTLDNIDKDIKNTSDKMIDDFIDNNRDVKIKNMKLEQKAMLKRYNEESSGGAEHDIQESVTITRTTENGVEKAYVNLTDAEIAEHISKGEELAGPPSEKSFEKLTSIELDAYNKKIAKSGSSELSIEIGNIEAQKAKIERTISDSGIAGDKK